MKRTPEELAAHHEAQALRHKLRAKIAGDPVLSEADSIRKAMVKLAELTPEGHEALGAIDAAYEALSGFFAELKP